MLELQTKLLGDKGRNDKFYSSLKATIRPGKSIVVDIGSGLGLLSFFAEKLGAKACYGFEADKTIFALSKRLSAENKMSRCKFFNIHSVEVKRLPGAPLDPAFGKRSSKSAAPGWPPMADIVISETLGNFALEENILETLQDAKRFLKPGGVMIPGRLTQYIAPVTSAAAYEKINVWDSVGYGISMSVAKKYALSHMYVHTFNKKDLLQQKNSVQIWDSINFTGKEQSIRNANIKWEIAQPVTLYGFAVWWNAELVPGIRISTSPFDAPTHWEQIFLPVMKPLPLAAGQSIAVEIKSDSRLFAGVSVNWNVYLK